MLHSERKPLKSILNFKLTRFIYELIIKLKKCSHELNKTYHWHSYSLLHWAIREDDGKVKNILDIVYKFNLNEYLDTVNEKGENCLHLACVMDKAEYIKPLINLGANPNTWDCNGNTPLHVAVAESRQMCIARIVDQSHYTPKSKPLDINLANDQGMTALHLAVKNHNLEAVKRLVEAGASVKMAERKHGNSILHIAVAERAVDIVRFLLQKTKVDVNQMTSSGYTPLHLACVCTETADSKEIVRLLLEHKADPMKANDSRVHVSFSYYYFFHYPPIVILGFDQTILTRLIFTPTDHRHIRPPV